MHVQLIKSSRFAWLQVITITTLLSACATGSGSTYTSGSSNYQSGLDAAQRCNQLWSNDQVSRKICIEHLQTPYRFIRSCLERGLKPGTDEFTYCGLAAMGRGGAAATTGTNRSSDLDKLNEEIKSLREQQEKAKRDKVFDDLLKEKRRY